MSESKPRVAPRVVAHIEKLRQAGLNTEAFFSALVGIRDDSALSNAHREALYRMIAMESYIWYLEALRGEPVDRFKLVEEARKVAEKNEVAIKKRTPGDSSAELALGDIGVDKTKGPRGPEGAPINDPPKIPQDGPTVRERIPKVAEAHAAKQRTPAKPGPTLNVRPPNKKK